MWQSIAAVALLPSLTTAQTQWQTAPTAPQQIVQGTIASSPVRYKSYTFYSAIRCGTKEEVAVEALGVGSVTVAKSPVAGIVPLKLELQPAEGLTFGQIGYPKAYPRKFGFQARPVNVAWPEVHFRVRANPNAVPGQRSIKGRLTFQPIRYDSSIGPVERLDVEIPINVVAHNTKVRKSTWPLPHTPTAAIVALVVLSPVIIPLAIVYYTVCGMEGPQRCPD